MLWLIEKYVKYLIIIVLLWFIIWGWNSFSCKRADTPHMEPVLIPGTVVTVYVKQRDLKDLQQGDMVGYEYFGIEPNTNFFIGRVIAKEGQRVKIEAGEIHIDGVHYKDNVPDQNRLRETIEEIVVPKDHLYILSDNRMYIPKVDSRAIGPINKDAILGKVKKGLPLF